MAAHLCHYKTIWSFFSASENALLFSAHFLSSSSTHKMLIIERGVHQDPLFQQDKSNSATTDIEWPPQVDFQPPIIKLSQ